MHDCIKQANWAEDAQRDKAEKVIENPCTALFEEVWNNFGYDTDEPCQVCGIKPAKIEPRFNYVVCQNHHNLSPFRISELVEKTKN